MTFKMLLSRSVQTPNSDKKWQTSCPLQKGGVVAQW